LFVEVCKHYCLVVILGDLHMPCHNTVTYLH